MFDILSKKPLWTLASKENPSTLIGIWVKGLKGCCRKGDRSFRRYSRVVCVNVVSGLLSRNYCLKMISPSPSFLPQLGNDKESCVNSWLKLAFRSFWRVASTGMNEQGPVSLCIHPGVPLGLAKLSFLGQMLGKPPTCLWGYTHMCACAYTHQNQIKWN